MPLTDQIGFRILSLKIIEEFQKSEASGGHRTDGFKIEGNFEDVVKRISKAEPETKKTSRSS
jgi:hypothetical protein